MTDPAYNFQLIWNLQEATQRCAQTNDWQCLHAATAALQQLYAVSKGKGKGKWGKGGKAKGKGGVPFQGECNHCCEKGRRLSQCPKLDAELVAKGMGRGSNGKGKGNGCKSLAYSGVDFEQQQPAEPQVAPAAPPTAQSAEDEWWMGASYCIIEDLPDIPPPLTSVCKTEAPDHRYHKFLRPPHLDYRR